MSPPLADLLARVRACRLCADHLPLGPRPVLRVTATARLLIVGQAPGTMVHHSGIPWNDRSGDRLRDWLGLDRAAFYDDSRVAIVPTGLCYPGRAANGGDRPPRAECAPAWFGPIRAHLAEIRLTLAIGSYAQALLLGRAARPTVSETVAAWREYLPTCLPLPHPSWRTTAWQRRHPWFDTELLPQARRLVRDVMEGPDTPA